MCGEGRKNVSPYRHGTGYVNQASLIIVSYVSMSVGGCVLTMHVKVRRQLSDLALSVHH